MFFDIFVGFPSNAVFRTLTKLVVNAKSKKYAQTLRDEMEKRHFEVPIELSDMLWTQDDFKDDIQDGSIAEERKEIALSRGRQYREKGVHSAKTKKENVPHKTKTVKLRQSLGVKT